MIRPRQEIASEIASGESPNGEESVPENHVHAVQSPLLHSR